MRATLQALRANRGKTALTFASLLFAVVSIFLITAVAKGVVGMYSQILQNDGDIIVTQADISDTFFSQVDRGLMERYRRVEGVRSVSAMIVGASPVGKLPIAAIYGVSSNRYGRYDLLRGSYPQKGEALLGSALFERLGQPEVVNVAGKSFGVSGVFESGIGFEKGGVVLPLEDAGAIFHKEASMLLVKTALHTDRNALVKRLRGISKKVEVKTTENFIDSYNQFKIIETSSWVISSVAFGMGILSIVSIMSIGVNERRSEFGIMRALGIPMRRILAMLMFEALAVTVSAYLAGVLLSLGALFVMKHAAFLQGYVSGEITSGLALYVFAATAAMGVLGAILPAMQAAKTDPLLLIQGNKT